MIALTLIASLSLGGVDTLSKQSLQGLNFKGPTAWQKSTPDENSIQWNEPASGAEFAVSVFPVDPVRPAKLCVKQLVEALGSEGFTALTLGAQPASKKVVVDFVGEDKNEANKVSTTTIVGCNGQKKWVLTWTGKVSMSARFGPMLKRVMDSITYGK